MPGVRQAAHRRGHAPGRRPRRPGRGGGAARDRRAMQSLIPLPEILSEIYQSARRARGSPITTKTSWAGSGPSSRSSMPFPWRTSGPRRRPSSPRRSPACADRKCFEMPATTACTARSACSGTPVLRRHTHGAPLFGEESPDPPRGRPDPPSPPELPREGRAPSPASARAERPELPSTVPPPARPDPSPGGAAHVATGAARSVARGGSTRTRASTGASAAATSLGRDAPDAARPPRRPPGRPGRRSAPGGRDRCRPAARRGRTRIREDQAPGPSSRASRHGPRGPAVPLSGRHLHPKGGRRDARAPAGAVAGAWEHVALHTFHSLGLSVLQEHWNAAGLQRGFRVASEAERLPTAHGRPARLPPGRPQPALRRLARQAHPDPAGGREARRGFRRVPERNGDPLPV